MKWLQQYAGLLLAFLALLLALGLLLSRS